jgi:hypothetical protein
VEQVTVRCRANAFAKALKVAPQLRGPGKWDTLLKLKLGRGAVAKLCQWRGTGNIIELLAGKI